MRYFKNKINTSQKQIFGAVLKVEVSASLPFIVFHRTLAINPLTQHGAAARFILYVLDSISILNHN